MVEAEKKDFSTAIMDRKKAPHKLQVEDSKADDNSIVEMTQAKMDELKIFKGDTVILKGTCLITSLFAGLSYAIPDDSFPLNVVIYCVYGVCLAWSCRPGPPHVDHLTIKPF